MSREGFFSFFEKKGTDTGRVLLEIDNIAQPVPCFMEEISGELYLFIHVGYNSNEKLADAIRKGNIQQCGTFRDSDNIYTFKGNLSELKLNGFEEIHEFFSKFYNQRSTNNPESYNLTSIFSDLLKTTNPKEGLNIINTAFPLIFANLKINDKTIKLNKTNMKNGPTYPDNSEYFGKYQINLDKLASVILNRPNNIMCLDNKNQFQHLENYKYDIDIEKLTFNNQGNLNKIKLLLDHFITIPENLTGKYKSLFIEGYVTRKTNGLYCLDLKLCNKSIVQHITAGGIRTIDVKKCGSSDDWIHEQILPTDRKNEFLSTDFKELNYNN
ncbi:MAG: hypothetical protein GY756_07590 [bacterium]|nr:hypothetical protein [bacterium]